MRTDQVAFSPGAIVGDRFTIVRALGRGSFGHTYLAEDRTRGRAVALKLFDPQGTDDWKARDLFQREAKVLGALRHHGVPEIYEATDVEWQSRRLPVLVMEFIDGASMADMIETRASHDLSDVTRLLFDLLSVLEYLHDRVPPVLHRDIKPANIIVRTNGTPVLVDFGSVRQVFRDADEGGSTIAGTYGYMPYEQYMGQASPASDLFSLGATFLHLLTGRPPKDFMNGDGHIVVPSNLPGSPALQSALARLLRASPQERFLSARQTREALLGMPPIGSGLPVVQQHSSPPAVKAGAFPMSAVQQREQLGRLAPSMFEYMDTSAKPNGRASIVYWIMLVAASAFTLGVYPLSFWAIARARKRKLRRFLKDGAPAMARIHRIDSEETAFKEHVARVHYEFEVDGVKHRDSDQALPLVAGRWELNQHIAILYIAGDPYDSIIVGDA